MDSRKKEESINLDKRAQAAVKLLDAKIKTVEKELSDLNALKKILYESMYNNYSKTKEDEIYLCKEDTFNIKYQAPIQRPYDLIAMSKSFGVFRFTEWKANV